MSTRVDEYCVICESENVSNKKRTMQFEVRGETLDIEVLSIVCSDCGCVETTEDPAEIAFSQYRKANHLLSSEEIKVARTKYGLSQKSFAKLLGMSEATVNRYEKGSLQNEAHDQAIRSCLVPEAMRDLYERRGDRLSDWQRQRFEDQRTC